MLFSFIHTHLILITLLFLLVIRIVTSFRSLPYRVCIIYIPLVCVCVCFFLFMHLFCKILSQLLKLIILLVSSLLHKTITFFFFLFSPLSKCSTYNHGSYYLFSARDNNTKRIDMWFWKRKILNHTHSIFISWEEKTDQFKCFSLYHKERNRVLQMEQKYIFIFFILFFLPVFNKKKKKLGKINVVCPYCQWG